MLNVTIWWMLMVPIVLSIIFVAVIPKRTKGEISTWMAIGFGAGGILISLLIFSGALYGSRASATADTQIINGEIVNKV